MTAIELLEDDMKKSQDESEQEFKKLPKATREISSFFYLVIDATIENLHTTYTWTGIRCFKKNCEGIICYSGFSPRRKVAKVFLGAFATLHEIFYSCLVVSPGPEPNRYA